MQRPPFRSSHGGARGAARHGHRRSRCHAQTRRTSVMRIGFMEFCPANSLSRGLSAMSNPDRQPTTESTTPRLLDPSIWTGKVFSGRWEPAASRIPVKEPATAELLGEVGDSQPGDMGAYVARAQAAQASWATSPADARAAIVRRAAQVLTENRQALLEGIVRETGGVPGKAEVELDGSIAELIHSAALLIQPEGHLLPSHDRSRLSLARRVPLGIVGVIAPWNFPMLLAMRSVAPAIALGNAVILKPDPQTPIVGGVAIARAFEEAGLPAGIFTVINGGAPVGEALVEAKGVRMITFTGSTAVGRRVGELAVAPVVVAEDEEDAIRMPMTPTTDSPARCKPPPSSADCAWHAGSAPGSC